MKATKELLFDMYVSKGMTVAMMAKELSIGRTTILYHMDKHDIKRRTTKEILKGKPKSIEHRKKLSEARKGNKNPNFGKKGNHGYRCWYVLPSGKTVSMRSQWEVWYAEYLRSNNILFEYEPKTFILDDGRAYTPDFFLPERNEFIEVKGWFTLQHKDRIENFRSKYPNEILILADKEYLENLGIDLRKKWIKTKPEFKCNLCQNNYHRSYPQQIYCSVACRNRAISFGMKSEINDNKTKRKYIGNQSGELNNSSKLDVNKVKLIKELKSQGMKIKDIIKITGSTYGNIYNITHGISWKEIDEKKL